jgi:hypothetical protein
MLGARLIDAANAIFVLVFQRRIIGGVDLSGRCHIEAPVIIDFGRLNNVANFKTDHIPIAADPHIHGALAMVHAIETEELGIKFLRFA